MSIEKLQSPRPDPTPHRSGDEYPLVAIILRRVLRFFMRSWAILAVLLLFLLPVGFFEKTPPICTYRILTGHECPTCGMTRACCALFHGDLNKAREFNRGVVVVAPLLILLALLQAWWLTKPYRKGKKTDVKSGDTDADDTRSRNG